MTSTIAADGDQPFTEPQMRVLEEVANMRAAGEPPSLSAAARAVGVSDVTARSWRRRHPAFDDAVSAAQGLPRPERGVVQLPRPVVNPQHEIDELLDLRKKLLGYIAYGRRLMHHGGGLGHVAHDARQQVRKYELELEWINDALASINRGPLPE